MSPTEVEEDILQECRVALIEPSTRRLLIAVSPAGCSLPRVSISANERLAAAGNAAIEQSLGLNTVQLAVLPDKNSGFFLVHEVVAPSYLRGACPLLEAIELDDVPPGQLSESEEHLLRSVIYGDDPSLGRFGRIGWVDELLQMEGFGLDRAAWPRIDQLNSGIDFCLLSTTLPDGSRRWFKAVGAPNTHEYALTLALCQHAPLMLPRLLHVLPEWNGWWSEDVHPGMRLDDSADVEDWRNTLRTFVHLQKSMVSRTQELCNAGARNWTASSFLELLDDFSLEAREASEAQTSSRVRRITPREIDDLRTSMEMGLLSCSRSGLPDCLNHGDIGHGNVIVTPDGPVFLDWAEGYIGLPFLTCEHLIADFDRSNPGRTQDVLLLRRSYIDFWGDFVAPPELCAVSALAPALAAFVYALTAWSGARGRKDPTSVWPFLRSMLRRTMRELESAHEVVA